MDVYTDMELTGETAVVASLAILSRNRGWRDLTERLRIGVAWPLSYRAFSGADDDVMHTVG